MIVFKFINHNRYAFIALLLSLFIVGCAFIQPKTSSPVTKTPVTRLELEAQHAAVEAGFKSAFADLDRKDAFLQNLNEVAMTAAAQVPGPWGGIALAVGTALTAGVGADNRRKDGVIKSLKKPVA